MSSNTIINLVIWHIDCVGHVNKVTVPVSSRAQWHLHFQQTLSAADVHYHWLLPSPPLSYDEPLASWVEM